MLKAVFAALCLFALPALADPLIVQPNSLVSPKVQADVGVKCKESCIILDQADWALLMEQVKQAQQRAYLQGKMDERKTL